MRRNFLCILVICLVPLSVARSQATREITYRLESDALLIAPDHGALVMDVPGITDRKAWHESYLQELRVYLKGKASARAGYRIDPRVQLEYAPDSAVVSSWVLDQGYAFVDFSDRVSLFVGKQRVRWGTGMTYTPTDRLQPAVNTLDPTRYLEGVLMARVSATLPWFSASAFYSPHRVNENLFQPADRLAGIRIYKLIHTTDFYLSLTHNFKSEVNCGAAFSSDTGPVVLYGEASYLKLQDASLPQTLGLIDRTAWKPRAVLGVSHQFNANTFGYLEGYYDGWGLDDRGYSTYRSRLQHDLDLIHTSPAIPALLDYAQLLLMARPALGLRQMYVAASGSYTYRSLLSVSGNAVWEPAGGSFYAYPFISYIGYENVEVMAGVSTAFGGSRSETAILPALYAVDLRFIVYF